MPFRPNHPSQHGIAESTGNGILDGIVAWIQVVMFFAFAMVFFAGIGGVVALVIGLSDALGAIVGAWLGFCLMLSIARRS